MLKPNLESNPSASKNKTLKSSHGPSLTQLQLKTAQRKHYLQILPFVIWLSLFWVENHSILASPRAMFTTEECMACHSNKTKTALPRDVLKGSPHEKLACTDCHSGIEGLPHVEKLSRVDCEGCHRYEAGEWRKSAHATKPGGPACSACHGGHQIQSLRTDNQAGLKVQVAELCRKCHDQIYEKFKSSVHEMALNQGFGASPTCTDCHGEHVIQGPRSAESRVAPVAIPMTCGHCHADQKTIANFGLPSDRLSTFKTSYHSVALEMGNLKAANCASCHGAHDVLRSADPASRTNPANLPRTCSGCHPEAKQGFAGIRIHVTVSPTGARAVWFVRVFYMGFIGILVLGFVLHILAEQVGAIREKRRGVGKITPEKGHSK